MAALLVLALSFAACENPAPEPEPQPEPQPEAATAENLHCRTTQPEWPEGYGSHKGRPCPPARCVPQQTWSPPP